MPLWIWRKQYKSPPEASGLPEGKRAKSKKLATYEVVTKNNN
jgi:hypothetical protein